jgi:choline dehydrogenase
MYTPNPNNWAYMSEPEPQLNNRSIYWPRGKVLGGSSAINGMLYVRGNPLDYDDWAQRGNRGWTWDELLPLFKRGELQQRGPSAAHGAVGELTVSDPLIRAAFSKKFIAAAGNKGFRPVEDFNAGVQDGVGFLQFNIKNGSRHSAYEAFIKPIRNRNNLTIVTDALTEEVLIEDGRATGVRYCKDGSVQTVKANLEVILASGVINSPQLLMLSGIGPGEHLRDFGINVKVSSPGVGQNLQDHLYTNLVYQVEPRLSINHRLRGVRAYLEGALYVALGRGNLTNGTSQTTMFARVMPGIDRPDVQINTRPMSFEFSKGKVEVGSKPAVTVSVCQLRPRSRGRVLLSSPLPDAPPKILAAYLSDDHDRQTMLRGVRLARGIVATEPVASAVKCEEASGATVQSDEELMSYVRASAQSVYHPVGTCKMGPDPMAVVDERLRVRGVKGLRVADASIMPVITSGNTHAPSVVIGEKASDLIHADNR